VATFNDREHAEPVVNRLQSAGFHPQLRDETKWQKRHLAEKLASVKVCVGENEFEPARARVKEWAAAENGLEQAIWCPECGSADVDFPQVTRKFVLPALHTFLYKVGLAEKEFYCHTCHCTWPLRLKVEPERDELNWPIKKSRLHENRDMTP
jgi:hypothetical protein